MSNKDFGRKKDLLVAVFVPLFSMEKVIVVGGGLSGLTLSYLFKKKNIDVTLLEASSRLGGRIETMEGKRGTPLELGATWFADKHENLTLLLEELGLQKFPQYSKGTTLFQTKSFEPPQEFTVPEAEDPSYRIVGGSQRLIYSLSEKIGMENIHLNKKVSAITGTETGISVTTADGTLWKADKAVICIPPQLAVAQIQFSPELPGSTRNLFDSVQTWMAGAIKFTVEYAEPFWRKNGFSGMLYSHADIVVEMYDQTNFEEDRYGLTGFLNGGAAGFNSRERKENILRQLSQLFGEEAAQPILYRDKI